MARETLLVHFRFLATVLGVLLSAVLPLPFDWFPQATSYAQLVPQLPNQQGGAIILPQQLQRRVPDAQLRNLMRGGRVQVVGGIPQPDGEAMTDASESFPEGGTLATNPDVEGILEKADRYLQEGNYRAASRFWQAAMKQAGDTLFTADGEFYFPLIRRIEAIIAGLPAEGLEVYRVSADAEAAGYLAEGQGDINQRMMALQKVVDFAFLSSQGDDAALELATIYLDRFEPFSADALLNRVVEVYPNPDVSMAEVWLKRAVAKTLIGDNEQAMAALQMVRQFEETPWASDNMQQQVVSMLEQSDPTSVVDADSSTDWTSSLGMGSTILQPAALDESYLGQSLSAAWMYRQLLREWSVGPRDSHVQGDVERDPLGIFLSGEPTGETAENAEDEGSDSADRARKRRDATRSSIEREWANSDWQSASLPLVANGKVYFKSQADLAGWSTEFAEKPGMRSPWLNRYAPDDLTHQLLNQSRAMQANYPGANRIEFDNLETMQFFGDQLFQSMVLHNGVVYSIEGKHYDRDERMPSQVHNNVNIWNAAPTRDRVTFLAAYDATSGKSLWDQPFPDPKDNNEFADAAIMGPPVGYHDSLIVPVLASGRFFVVGLSTQSGELRWKQSICDSPTISSSALTVVQLAVAGNDIFMTCGCGILAKVDASTGQLRWIHRYKRSVLDSSPNNANQRVFGLNRQWLNKEVDGWQHDLVLVWGPWVIMAASDNDALVGYERTSGEFVWMAPRSSVLGCTVDQVLTVKDGILYAVGARGLLAYELPAQGRLYGTPQRLDGKISGRGLVMNESVILPMGNHLQLFDRKTLKPVRGISVQMPDDAPIGTIVSDGKRLWSAAMGLLVALEPTPGNAKQMSSEGDQQDSSSDDTDPESSDGESQTVSLR